MLAEIERGADAVGGIPSTALKGAGLLPHIRATVKLPMIVMKRTLQQLLGGAPFIISGACGMFRTDVLRKFGFSDRTKVEDLDLTWTLVANGYRIRQANRCIVYPQECNSPREEWRRWRRWIVGYAVCMRLHKRLLFSRFGIFSIFPMLLVVLYGVGIYLTTWFNEFITTGPYGVVLAMFPLIWVGVVCVIGAFSALVSSLLVVGAFSTAFRCVCIISLCHLDYLWTYCLFYWTRTSARQTHPLFRTGGSVNLLFPTFCHRN